jgi:hypothetical protein
MGCTLSQSPVVKPSTVKPGLQPPPDGAGNQCPEGSHPLQLFLCLPFAPGLLRGRPVLLRSEGRLERSFAHRGTWQAYGERRTGEPDPRRERVWNRHGTVMYGRLRHGQRDQETVIRKGVHVDQKSWIKRKGFRAFVSTYLELEN